MKNTTHSNCNAISQTLLQILNKGKSPTQETVRHYKKFPQRISITFVDILVPIEMLTEEYALQNTHGYLTYEDLAFSLNTFW